MLTEPADPATESCVARDCLKAAIWASPIRECGTTFLVPVCREHGTPLSPVHGIVGLDNFMRREGCGQRIDSDARFHVPEVAQRGDGRWGVFCAACSATVGDYINPCRQFIDGDREWWPPPILEATDGT